MGGRPSLTPVRWSVPERRHSSYRCLDQDPAGGTNTLETVVTNGWEHTGALPEARRGTALGHLATVLKAVEARSGRDMQDIGQVDEVPTYPVGGVGVR